MDCGSFTMAPLTAKVQVLFADDTDHLQFSEWKISSKLGMSLVDHKFVIILIYSCYGYAGLFP